MNITIKTDNLTILDIHPAVKPPDGLSWCCRGSPPQPSWRLYLMWTDSAKIEILGIHAALKLENSRLNVV